MNTQENTKLKLPEKLMLSVDNVTGEPQAGLFLKAAPEGVQNKLTITTYGTDVEALARVVSVRYNTQPELLNALQAIKSRLNEDWDCPALGAFGIKVDMVENVMHIVDSAIAKATAQ